MVDNEYLTVSEEVEQRLSKLTWDELKEMNRVVGINLVQSKGYTEEQNAEAHIRKIMKLVYEEPPLRWDRVCNYVGVKTKNERVELQSAEIVDLAREANRKSLNANIIASIALVVAAISVFISWWVSTR